MFVQLKEERKKLRLKKTEKPQAEEVKKEETTTANSAAAAVEDVGAKDKSFDNLSSLTSDVTNKVGSVGQSVKSGVEVISRLFFVERYS